MAKNINEAIADLSTATPVAIDTEIVLFQDAIGQAARPIRFAESQIKRFGEMIAEHGDEIFDDSTILVSLAAVRAAQAA
jgi:hypothetical protein